MLIKPCEFEVSFVMVDKTCRFQPTLRATMDSNHGTQPIQYSLKSKFISADKLIPVMAKEYIPVPALTMVAFVDVQKIDHASKYHSF